MFAFIPGLGGQEILLLGILAVLVVGVIIVLRVIRAKEAKKKSHPDDDGE
jgi:hypothetical protein